MLTFHSRKWSQEREKYCTFLALLLEFIRKTQNLTSKIESFYKKDSSISKYEDIDANVVIINLQKALEDYLAEVNEFVLQEKSPAGEHFLGRIFAQTLKGINLTYHFLSFQDNILSIL